AAMYSVGQVDIGRAGTGGQTMMGFFNGGGACGSITTVGSATAFNTTSDARLKTDRGRRTDTDVLSRTVIHDFTWKVDGAPGRGVFAQEAISVAPYCVTEGGDDVDDQGRLKQAWAVD